MRNIIFMLWVCFLPLPSMTFAQEATGADFLKIGVGVRQEGMGGTFTGVGDDGYTIFWNPGGLGFIRNWQLSGSYTRWIADMHCLSLLFSKQFRFRLSSLSSERFKWLEWITRKFDSRKAAIGIGFFSLGMPDWDNTEGLEESVSASDMLAIVSFGQRLDGLTKMLSFGINLKYIQSKLAGYKATAYASDVGILFKPSKFGLGFLKFGPFEQGIFSLGLAVQNIIRTKMTFISYRSKLPVIIRGGLAFRLLGDKTHNLLLAADLSKATGGKQKIFGGLEYWWKDTIGFRSGYKTLAEGLNRDALGIDWSSFTFGISFKASDPLFTSLPFIRWNTHQIDYAGSDYGEVLETTHRSSYSLYPIGPEPFHLGEPSDQTAFKSKTIKFTWEEAIDPDPYDKVRYLLLVYDNEDSLNNAIKKAKDDLGKFKNSNTIGQIEQNINYQENRQESVEGAVQLIKKFYAKMSEEDRSKLKKYQLHKEIAAHDSIRVSLDFEKRGYYYWTIIAYDQDNHAREGKGSGKYRKFFIQHPDLTAKFDIKKRWIKEANNNYRGELNVIIKNEGKGHADSFKVAVWDIPKGETKIDTIISIAKLDSAGAKHFFCNWHSTGEHPDIISAIVDVDSAEEESNEDNNRIEDLLTIPGTVKVGSIADGKFTRRDTISVEKKEYTHIEVPLVPIVFFDPNFATVKSEFYKNDGAIMPVLCTLADRLKNMPIVLKGFIDKRSGEIDSALATQRAKAVKSIMVDSLRVDASLIQISTDHDKTELHIKRTSVNPKEQKMINEENRRVEFYLDPEEYKKILFGPWKIPTLRTISDSIIFSVEFESPAGVNKWGVKIMDRFKKLVISLTETSRITKTRVSCRIPWHAKNEYGKIVPLNAAYYYLLEIEDAVGRKFETRLDSFYIKTRATIIKEEIFAIAEFNTAKPIYNFYWERLGDVADSLRNNPDLRVRFEGHTCIIGSPSHNDKLSCERSDTLTNAFIDTLQRRESQSDIARVDVNVNARCKNCGFESGLGSGFDEPLTIQIPSSKLFELRIPTPFGLDVQFTIPFHDFKEVLFGDNGTPLGRNLNRRIMICLYKIE